MLGNMLLCIGYRGYFGYMKDEIYWIYFIYKRLKAAHSDVGQYVAVYWISGSILSGTDTAGVAFPSLTWNKYFLGKYK